MELNTNTLFLACLVILVIYFIYQNYGKETYTTCNEKAQAVHNWFKSNNEPEYTRYRSHIENGDVVEYHDLMTRHRANGGNLSLNDVTDTLGCPM